MQQDSRNPRGLQKNTREQVFQACAENVIGVNTKWQRLHRCSTTGHVKWCRHMIAPTNVPIL